MGWLSGRVNRRGWLAFVVMALAVASSCSSGTTTTGRVSDTSTSAAADSEVASSTSPGSPCDTGPSAMKPVEHVVWVWMENHTAESVLGAPDAPFETRLREQCGSSSTYQSVGSPSLPNYVGATSGDTAGIADDGSPGEHPLASDNLFRQTRAAGLASRSYEEAMTAPCQLTSTGRYAVKHNPAAYYVGEQDRPACQHDDIALGDPTSGPLADDLAQDTLPAFSFITPDLCHDTHDCPVADGDRWLAQWLPTLFDSTAYRSGTTIVFIAWDEPTPMPLLVVAPRVASGTSSAQPFNHYSLLRTTEELLDLPLLGQAAHANSIRAAFGL